MTELWLTAALAVIGLLTAFVIGWQAWETRKSAQAAAVSAAAAQRAADVAENSLSLLNRPYLDASNWQAVYQSGQGFGDRPRTAIKFEVVNPAPIPARLKTIMFSALINGKEPSGIAKQMDVNSDVNPRQSLPFSCDIDVMATLESQRAFYSDEGLRITIVGTFTYSDVFCQPDEERTVLFARLAVLRHPDKEFSFEFTAAT